jgi:hypothetical protein
MALDLRELITGLDRAAGDLDDLGLDARLACFDDGDCLLDLRAVGIEPARVDPAVEAPFLLFARRERRQHLECLALAGNVVLDVAVELRE